jgi:PAS domain S-box-containing protein
MKTNINKDSFSWLTHNSPISLLIRERDWTKTSLGHPDTWDQSLKTLINTSLESRYPMFVWWGPDLISFYNEAYTEIVGPIKHSKFFGDSARNLWSEIWDTLQIFVDRIYKGELVSEDKLKLMMERKGYREETYFTFCYSPIRNDAGEINGVFCTCQEVTEQVLSEQKIKQARLETDHAYEQLNDFFMQAPAPMLIMLGPDHHFWLANPPYEELMQRKVVGKNVLEIFTSDEVENFIPLLDKVYTTGVPYIGKEVQFNLHRNGKIDEKFLNFGYHPFLNADKSVKGILAVVEDVTEEVTLRKQIEMSRNELQVLNESIPQIVWTAGSDGVLDYTNSRWVEYSGSTDPSQWINFVHPEDVKRVEKTWLSSIDSGDDYETEFRIRRKDGIYHTFLVRASAIRHARGEVVKWYGTCTDIEDQKLIVTQLENEKILREQFVSMLTHDLRSPLSAAKISAQFMQRTTLNQEKITSLSGRIIESLNRADNMIENLLDANRIKAGERLPLKIEKFDLVELISDSLIDLATIHGDRFRLNSNLPKVEGFWSPEGILRIIENLCTNAVKFGREHSPISVLINQENSHVTICVHNFGIPIPIEEQKKLFDPYQRSNRMDKEAVVGWGLGLTLVKGLAESHGGSVKVDSSEREGTTFSITIPLDSTFKE